MLQNCLQELGQSNAFPIQLGYEHIFSTVTVQNNPPPAPFSLFKKEQQDKKQVQRRLYGAHEALC